MAHVLILIPKMRKSISSQREVIHADLLAHEAPMIVRKFDNVRKDIAYAAMSLRLHLRFSGNHVLHLVLHDSSASCALGN